MDLFRNRLLIRFRLPILDKKLQWLFLHRLSRLLQNGYTLIEALEIIHWDTRLQEPSETVMAALKDGNSLDEAFKHARFSQIITTYLYFVQANGNIQASIAKCLLMYEQRMQYTKKFQQVTRYPFLLLIIFSVVLYFIKQLVLPSFANLFQSTQDSSTTVSVMVMLINFLTYTVFVLILFAFLLFLVWQFNKKRLDVTWQIKLYTHIPFYRKYKQLRTSFLFATHFSSMLKTGIPIKDILLTMQKQVNLPILAHYAGLMIDEFNQGRHLEGLLGQLSLLDKQIATIFQKNADTTALEKDLSMYAEFVTEEMQQKIMKTLTYVQPAFFIIVACLIIFIYVSLMWPMFQLIKTI